MRKDRAFMLAAALAVPTALHAGPREDAACVIGRLSAADVQTIVDESVRGGSSEAVSRLTPAMNACAAGEDWQPRRRGEAAAYTIGTIDRTMLGQRLSADGVELAALDRWFARQSDAFRTTAFISLDEATMRTTFETLSGHEVPDAVVARVAPVLGGYIAALVIIERIDRGLGME